MSLLLLLLLDGSVDTTPEIPLPAPTGNAIFQAYDENILRSAVWSGDDPSDSYSLEAFDRLDPAARVRYDSGSAVVVATISSKRGDVLVVPVTNADSLVVTNTAGLSVDVPIPSMTRNRIPRTIVCDLSIEEPDLETRRAGVWTFTFGCSTDDVIIGAAIGLYAPRRDLLFGDFQWGGSESRVTFGKSHRNVAGVRYQLSDNTQRRSFSSTKLATQDDLDEILEWFGANRGRFQKAFLWPDPDVNDGYLGTLQETLEIVRKAPTSAGTLYEVTIQFDELSKGRPV